MEYKKGEYYTICGNILKFNHINTNNEVIYDYILKQNKTFDSTGRILIAGDMQEANVGEKRIILGHIHNYLAASSLLKKDENSFFEYLNTNSYDIMNAESDDEKEEAIKNAYLAGIEEGRKAINVKYYNEKIYPKLHEQVILYMADGNYSIAELIQSFPPKNGAYLWQDINGDVITDMFNYKWRYIKNEE